MTFQSRFVPGSVDGIRRALEWAGLEYDFGACFCSPYCCMGFLNITTSGPGKNGPHAPYFQSERLDLYQDYAKKLLDVGFLPAPATLRLIHSLSLAMHTVAFAAWIV